MKNLKSKHSMKSNDDFIKLKCYYQYNIASTINKVCKSHVKKFNPSETGLAEKIAEEIVINYLSNHNMLNSCNMIREETQNMIKKRHENGWVARKLRLTNRKSNIIELLDEFCPVLSTSEGEAYDSYLKQMRRLSEAGGKSYLSDRKFLNMTEIHSRNSISLHDHSSNPRVNQYSESRCSPMHSFVHYNENINYQTHNKSKYGKSGYSMHNHNNCNENKGNPKQQFTCTYSMTPDRASAMPINQTPFYHVYNEPSVSSSCSEQAAGSQFVTERDIQQRKTFNEKLMEKRNQDSEKEKISTKKHGIPNLSNVESSAEVEEWRMLEHPEYEPTINSECPFEDRIKNILRVNPSYPTVPLPDSLTLDQKIEREERLDSMTKDQLKKQIILMQEQQQILLKQQRQIQSMVRAQSSVLPVFIPSNANSYVGDDEENPSTSIRNLSMPKSGTKRKNEKKFKFKIDKGPKIPEFPSISKNQKDTNTIFSEPGSVHDTASISDDFEFKDDYFNKNRFMQNGYKSNMSFDYNAAFQLPQMMNGSQSMQNSYMMSQQQYSSPIQQNTGKKSSTASNHPPQMPLVEIPVNSKPKPSRRKSKLSNTSYQSNKSYEEYESSDSYSSQNITSSSKSITKSSLASNKKSSPKSLSDSDSDSSSSYVIEEEEEEDGDIEYTYDD